jgi:hypothetical protein
MTYGQAKQLLDGLRMLRNNIDAVVQMVDCLPSAWSGPQGDAATRLVEETTILLAAQAKELQEIFLTPRSSGQE